MTLSEILQKHYSYEETTSWAFRYLYVPPIAIAAYLSFIFGVKKWMEGKEALDLRGPLVLWNLCLTLFSIVGACTLIPPIVQVVATEGFVYGVCEVSTNPMYSFVGVLFVLSKIVEFGDTFFIVLRKSPLTFLHWYHHITVLWYSWYGFATGCTAGHWFGALNFTVHSVMYFYYMLKALGYRVPSSVAKSITILQLTQFFIGLSILFVGMWARWLGRECGVNATHIKVGLIVYGSYFILFLNFFYHRYSLALKKAK